MKKLKVAIIDTGINLGHIFFKNKNIKISGKSISYINGKLVYDDNFIDENGHGTACASVIVNLFNDVELYCLKVLNKYGKTNLKVLEEALRHLKDDVDVDVISLSVSISDNCDLKVIKNHCDELYDKGVYIVSSLGNGYLKSFPASFKSVIGVHGKILITDYTYWFNKNKEIQCIMDNNPVFACGIESDNYILFEKSNSLSCAKFTGILCKMLSIDNSFEYNIDILESSAEKKEWCNMDIFKSERLPKRKSGIKKDNVILKKIIRIICEFYSIDEIEDIYINLFSVKVGLTNYNVYELICKIEEEFGIKINIFKLNRYDFLSVYSLYDIILKNI